MSSPEEQQRIDTIVEQLQAKIRSKVQASTFLAGFASTLLGIEIARLWEPNDVPQLLFVAIPFLLGAAFLYIHAVMKLDGLTMPRPFWVEWKDLATWEFCHESYSTVEDLRKLKEAMVYYWVRLVYVATGSVALSLALMLIPLTTNFSATLLWSTLGLSIIVVSFAFAYCARLGRHVKKEWSLTWMD